MTEPGIWDDWDALHLQAAANAAAYLNPAHKRAAEQEANKKYLVFESSAEGVLLHTMFRAFSQAQVLPSLSRPLQPGGEEYGRGFSAGMALSVLYQALHNVYSVQKPLHEPDTYQQQQFRKLLGELAELVARVEPQRELREFQQGHWGENS